MPEAIVSVTQLTNPTQAELIAGINTAMLRAGYPALNSQWEDSSGTHLAYSFTADKAVAQGRATVEVIISTSNYVRTRIHSADFSANTTTSTAQSAYTANTLFSSTSQDAVILHSINHPELRGTMVSQGNSSHFLGYLRPADKPYWWDESKESFFLCPYNGAFDRFDCCLSPYSRSDFYRETNSGFYYTNPKTEKPEIAQGLMMRYYSNYGSAGKTSTDLGNAAAYGQKIGNLFTPSATEQFLLLSINSSGLAIRCTWPEEY